MKPLPNGIVDVEMFETAKGEMVFLETQARRPGNLFNDLYKYTSGIDMEVLGFNAVLGGKLILPKSKNASTQISYFAGSVEYPMKAGKVSEVLAPDIKSEFYIKYKAKKGDVLQNAKNVQEAAAYIVLWNKNRNILIQDIKNLTSQFYPYTLIPAEVS